MIVISILFWVVLGLALLAAEMLTLSFVLVFFGIGALIVALLKWLLNLESMPLEILIFAVISVSGLLLLRKKFKSGIGHKDGMSIDQGTIVILTRDVPARGRAEIEYQGTVWTAENESDRNLIKGERAVILRTDGLKLMIKGV